MTVLYDRDPEDEDVEHPETGLCANSWCQDAALPEDEFCRECALEAERLLAELDFPPEAA